MCSNAEQETEREREKKQNICEKTNEFKATSIFLCFFLSVSIASNLLAAPMTEWDFLAVDDVLALNVRFCFHHIFK